MIGASFRPSGRTPVVKAVMIWPWSSAEAGFLIGRQIPSDEDAEAGNGETDIGPAEILGHVGMAEKIPRRVAIVAAAHLDQVFAARRLRVGVGQALDAAQDAAIKPAASRP